MFTIVVWDAAEWKKERESPDCKDFVTLGCPDDATIIKKTESCVFAINFPHETPDDLVPLWVERDDVVKWFFIDSK